MSTHQEQLVSVAKAEDTYNLMHNIAWTDVIKPMLAKHMDQYTQLLVAEALGAPLPQGITREQVAGRCYGIQYISTLFEKILKEGEKALKDLQIAGISPSSTLG